MLRVANLTIEYGRRAALRNLSFALGQGEFVLITGPSGCGKSTLALALAGLIPHTVQAAFRGEVLINGISTRTRSLSDLAPHIGIVFQNPASQLFNDTVEEEVAFAPRNLGLSQEEIERRTYFALESTGILHLRDREVDRLSMGEKQRVAIASILSLRPRVLVLDEPTANLDWKGVEQVMDTLSELNRRLGMTVLLFEHRLSAVYHRAGRVLILSRGCLVAEGTPDEVFADKGRLIELGLRFPWRQVIKGAERYVPQGIHPPVSGEDPLVELKGIEAGYGRRRVLERIDFTIHPGEFIALVGDNGAGKSTLARVLTGLIRARRGQVLWNRRLRKQPLGRRAGYLFQNALDQLLCDRVEEEAALAAENFGLPVEERLEDALSGTGLKGFRRRSTRSLSIGEKQRTALAAVLSADPDLLILDEPTLGQDWMHLSLLMEYLMRLTRLGKAVLLITHDDKLVCRFARRIVHLVEGRIVADGLPEVAPARELTTVEENKK